MSSPFLIRPRSPAPGTINPFAPTGVATGGNTWDGVPGAAIDNAGTMALAAASAYYFPFYVDRPILITRAAFICSTAGALSVARMGIYTFDWSTYQAGSRMWDQGATSDTSSTGEKAATGLSVSLPEGHYASVLACKTLGITIAYLSGPIPGVQLVRAVGTAFNGVVYATSGSADADVAYPATAPAVSGQGSSAPVLRHPIIYRYTAA